MFAKHASFVLQAEHGGTPRFPKCLQLFLVLAEKDCVLKVHAQETETAPPDEQAKLKQKAAACASVPLQLIRESLWLRLDLQATLNVELLHETLVP